PTATASGLSTAQANATATAQAVATANVAATATATIANQNPYPPFGGRLVLNDPLKDNSKGYQWDEGNFADGVTCGFSGGAYHITKTQQGFFGCNPELSSLHNLQNFAFQVRAKVIQGDEEGIFFRATENVGFYYLTVFTSGKYAGDYGFYVDTQAGYKLLSGKASAFINTGQNATNVI